MAGGGSKGSTTVQSADPWWATGDAMQDIYGRAKNAADRTPDFTFGDYSQWNNGGGRYVAGANDTQRDGQRMLQNYGYGLQGVGQPVQDEANKMLRGEYLQNNPYLQNAINATIAPTIRQTREQVMPALGGAAASAGAFGGSRQAMLEGMALRDMDTTVAETAAKMYMDNYQTERGLMTQVAPGMLQQGIGLNGLASQYVSAAGDRGREFQNWDIQNLQGGFEDEINRYWRSVNPYAQVVGGLGSGGGRTTQTSNAGGSGLGGAISGAAGLGSLCLMAGNAGLLGGLGLAGPGGLLLGAALGAGAGMLR